MTQELSREERLRRTSNPNDPLHVLTRYSLMMDKLYETVARLTADQPYEIVTELLGGIEDYDDKIREYFYEEAAAELGDVDPTSGGFVFTELPPEVRLIPTQHGFTIPHLPVWMLGHGARQNRHPMYHRNRPFVRKRDVWRALFHQLRWDYLKQAGTWEDSLIPKRPPAYARLWVTIRSASQSDVRDLDHFLPPLAAVINGLVSNRLIASDSPDHLCYAVQWEMTDGLDEACADLVVEWSHHGLVAWR